MHIASYSYGRAQTSTPVLYRRWPSRAELVLAAVGRQPGPTDQLPDTGDLRTDLLAHLRRVARRFEGVLGEAVRGLLVDTNHNEELSGLLQAQVGRLSSQAQIAAILQWAVDRGDIDPGVVTARVLALPLDLLRNEAVVRGTPVPDAAVVGIIDEIVLPLLTGGTDGLRCAWRQRRRDGPRVATTCPTLCVMAPVLDRASIDRAAADLDGDLIALRRDIHRWPELAGGERRTAALVADRLRAEGLAVSVGVGGHGVVAVLDGEGNGPTIAYRADMDAVAGSELFDSEYTSQAPGAAHLCGHDIHTAIGVGIAQVLGRLRHRLSGRIVFVFQPAEETLDGARAMIADGVFYRTGPQEVYALHCSPSPVGTLAVMPGSGLPGQDRYDIELSGPNAAEDGRRLLAAIDALSTVAYPQTPEQFEQLIGDLQTPDGPLARFVFAQSDLTTDGRRAHTRTWLRAWPDDRYPEIRAEVQRLVQSIDGARIEFPAQPFPAMVCSPRLSEAAATYLRDTIGPQAVVVLHAAFPFNGEDFALFLQHTPGAMLYLGVANPAEGINGIPHAPDFAADERAIGVGVRAMTGLLSNRLHVLNRL